MNALVSRLRDRLIRLSLNFRLLALVVGVVGLLLAASTLALHWSTRSFITESAGLELSTAERVWERFYELRSRRLLSAVSVLAEDFGFREAVASGDEATGLSALLNHAGRVDADVALLLSPAGDPILVVPEIDFDALKPALDALLESASSRRGLVGFVELEGRGMQLALVPVRGPDRLAWAGFGFLISEAVLEDYRALTGAELSLLPRGAGDVLASTLEPAKAAALVGVQGLAGPGEDPLRIAGDRVLRILSLHSADGGRNPVVLEFDRARFAAPMDQLKARVLQLSLLVALPALLFALFAAKSISRPLQQLTATVTRIAAGDYRQRPIISGAYELRQLASAVVTMQQEIEDREARIQRQSREDPMTGLSNRSDALAALLRMQRAGEPMRLMLFDIRRFSEINDALGPEVGDHLLAAVGARLLELQPAAMIARLGANEFMSLDRLRPGRPPHVQLLDILTSLDAPYELQSVVLRVDFCAAWADYPQHSDGGAELLRRAQLALADAKREGQAICGYRPGSEDRHLRQLQLLADLRGAEDRGELSLVFQPKVDLRSGRVVHAEALLRWRHAELGPIGPDEFVPLAERSGQIGRLTRFVLAQAIEACSEWHRAGFDLVVAVNLSANDLADSALAVHIHETLDAQSFPADRLIVEVTESAVMRDVAHAIVQLQELRAGGVRVAIDDFGTGQSSLAQLQRLPADELKIDKSFVLTLEPDSSNAEIVRVTVELGHRLGMSVIAEGVETEQGLKVLRELGCDLGQGYFFSRPLTSEALMAWCLQFEAAARNTNDGAAE